MASTVSCVPLQAIPVSNTNGVLVTGPCILLKATTVAQQMQALRPKASGNEEKEILRCKRKIDFAKLGYNAPKAGAVSRRNERERNRVKLVNNGFEVLREHVPCIKKNKKLSKVETLRRAVEYIKRLQQMIDDSDSICGDTNDVVFSDTDSMGSSYADSNSLSPSLPMLIPNSSESTYQSMMAPMTSPSQDSLVHSPTPSLSSSSDTSYDSLSSSIDDDILDFWINNEMYSANFAQDLHMNVHATS
ncbi:hypothetical protein SNE40_018475 [Patella caerulea]|uniref:BHLH domain-containing protein n=1 Tax=Patella caerulea TaxID=87958 RepID=A0AAN8J531_PATCE